jgi:hypothetical protein
MGLTVSTSSSTSHPKNALITDQCVLMVKGARPACSIASTTAMMSRWVTICGNIEPSDGAHHFDQ